jgi:hypothetical protein
MKGGDIRMKFDRGDVVKAGGLLGSLIGMAITSILFDKAQDYIANRKASKISDDTLDYTVSQKNTKVVDDDQ